MFMFWEANDPPFVCDNPFWFMLNIELGLRDPLVPELFGPIPLSCRVSFSESKLKNLSVSRIKLSEFFKYSIRMSKPLSGGSKNLCTQSIRLVRSETSKFLISSVDVSFIVYLARLYKKDQSFCKFLVQ